MFHLRLLAICTALALSPFAAPAMASNAPATPQASDCTEAPIAIGDLQELVLSGTPIAATPTAAVAITPDIAAEIAATIKMSVACTNANQPLRALALFTPNYLIARFSGAGADDLGHLTAAVTRDPAPAVAADELSIVSIGTLKALNDGRVSVLVTTANTNETFADVLIFTRVGDRWLIDETHTAATVPATPAVSG